MRDLGYQGLLVITFFGVAVAGLIYAKMIEPVLISPPVKVQYWNYKNVNTIDEMDVNLKLETIDEVQKMDVSVGHLENL